MHPTSKYLTPAYSLYSKYRSPCHKAPIVPGSAYRVDWGRIDLPMKPPRTPHKVFVYYCGQCDLMCSDPIWSHEPDQYTELLRIMQP